VERAPSPAAFDFVLGSAFVFGFASASIAACSNVEERRFSAA
jgi:hypothetical protein